ncbi:Nn.00g060830.m01.CDS01 [Neocucurbitaria sp. VM-36]
MAKFHEIPAELRNILYSELLMNSGRRSPRQRALNEFALFTVSRQVHDESTSYFYQNGDIAIDALADATNVATILPPIADKYLQFLRRLTMHTLTGQASMPSVRKVANAITSLASIGADFDELSIWIISPLSHLLNSRVDDSIMEIDHPIIVALRRLIASGVAKTIRLRLKNTWFAPGVAQALYTENRSRLEIFVSDAHTTDLSSLERPLTGRYSSTHLSALSLDHEDINSCSASGSSSGSTPSSLPSSICSAFADLDAFSVSSFELSAADAAEKHERGQSESADAHDEMDEVTFFTDDDIEEWQASTQDLDHARLDENSNRNVDLNDDDGDGDADEEMEDVPQDVIEAIIGNMEEMEHHVANEADVTYMANFAPELLLTRHHLGHLV